MNLKDLHIDRSWTLFLDRDGVINRKLENDYVKHWTDFEFLAGSIEALKKVGSVFGVIVVVTNQQGIGKGLYRTEDLELIHKNMLYEVNYFGGRIDRIYFSPYLDKENHITRKPNTGMGLKAKEDFPQIDFTKSIMVGDSMTDMQFGRKLGMRTVFIGKDRKNGVEIDTCFDSLLDFADSLT